MPTWPWESDGPADTLTPPPDVLARIPTLDRATNWSKSTLRLRVDNKFVLHHIMVVCFDLRVYDKAAGKKGDLMVQAATVLNEKILSKSVTKVRIGSKEEWRKPALLTQNNLKTIVDTELSRFSILNKTEERATGEGEPAEQTPESIAASQELQLYWSTCTHLLEMQVQSAAPKNSADEDHRQKMAALGDELLQRVKPKAAKSSPNVSKAGPGTPTADEDGDSESESATPSGGRRKSMGASFAGEILEF
jgi:hypothetical protein